MSYKLNYRLEGDYYLPNFTLPDIPDIGRYGQLRHRYLRNHKSSVFGAMLMQGTLNRHLEETDKAANEISEYLLKKYKEKHNITEKLKEENQLEWVKQMNNIHSTVDEIVLKELIYI